MSTLTRLDVARMVHDEMDLLAEKFTPLPDERGRAEGDYTPLLDRAMRDLGVVSLSGCTDLQVNAVVAGVSYYAYRRVVNYRSVNVSTSGGVGAAGRRDVDWNLHLRELKSVLKDYREAYERAAAAVGVVLGPYARGEQSTVRVDDEGVAANLVSPTVGVGLPWFREGYHEEDDEWHS